MHMPYLIAQHECCVSMKGVSVDCMGCICDFHANYLAVCNDAGYGTLGLDLNSFWPDAHSVLHALTFVCTKPDTALIQGNKVCKRNVSS